nr:c-type cytochrome domain-containing protein [Nannocystis sp. RBIL2]
MDASSTTDEPPAPECESRRLETQAILQTRCGSCHGEQGKEEFSNITDLDAMMATGKIVPGDPANSLIYQRIVLGEMPPPSQAGVSTEEMAVLGAWIGECSAPGGGRSPDPQSEPRCAPEAPVTMEQWLDMIHSDLSKLDPNDRQFQRYISFIDVYNAGYCPAQLKTYRQALTKLLNSLSEKSKPAFPVEIAGSHDAIFRIDLRLFGWDADLWDKIACANPYSVDYGVNEAYPVAAAIQDALKNEQGRKVTLFVQPGRSFMNIVARPPLYHEILRIPATLAELAAAKSGIDDLAANALAEQNNQALDLVARAGFYSSGVAEVNRIVERQEISSDGYFWHSFDFADRNGLRNIFAHPLDFQADGGEVIFSLPNGFQAYAIVNHLGQRLDKAPIEIVKDLDNEEDEIAVVNGISCMGCHVSGIIVRADEIRAHIMSNMEDYVSQSIVGVKNLYPEGNVMDLQQTDSDSFMKALEKVQVPVVIEADDGGLIEPIRIADFAFLRVELTTALAAAEIGTSPEKLLSIEQTVPDIALLYDGGALKREDFGDMFAPSVEALQIGDAQPIAACTPG